MKRLVNIGLLAVALVLAAGCVKFKQLITLNPDGSGKMQLTLGVSEQMLTMAAEDPFADLNPEQMAVQEAHGWAAFTRPQIRTEGGFKIATLTGYFEDINAVSFANDTTDAPEEQMQAVTYRFEGGVLTVRHGPLGQVITDMTADGALESPDMKAMMAPMMAGMELTECYRLPGQITAAADGYSIEGDKACATLTDQDLLGDTPPALAALTDGVLTLTFEPAGWAEGAQAAWEHELAEARAAWQAVKDETEAAEQAAEEAAASPTP